MKLKEWHKIVLIIIFSFIVAGIFYQSLLSGLSRGPAPVEKNSILELVIAGEVDERTVDDPIIEAIGQTELLSVQALLQAIRKAKIDDNIAGILIRPLGLSTGWGKAEEIRNALLDFKTTGKPVYAFLEVGGNKEYYLASAADTIVGYGTGFLFVNGFASEPVFLKETLDKIGIEADFIAHGKYKNAPDVFTRENMSEAQREVINSVLDQLYSHLVTTLAEARNLDETAIRQYIDRGFFTLEEGAQYGFIDTLMYYNEFKDYLKEQSGDKLQFVSLERYKDIPYSSLGVTAEETFAVIYGVGTIVIGGEDQFGQDGLITSQGMANNIRSAAENDRIKAIILRIDSPGGSGSASDVIWHEVVEARKKKPVIVSISDLAASGGYYISMAADTIVAHPNSLVGSIGVFAGKFTWNKFYQKIGLNKESIYRGKNADLFSETKTFSPEQRQMIRNFVMDFYNDFIGKVAQGRQMTVEEVDEIARGRVWTGAQAKEIGLVDELGDFHTAVQIAKQMTGILEDEAVALAVYPKLKTFFQRLLNGGISTGSFLEKLPGGYNIPPSMRHVILALPHFRDGEPLFLYTVDF